MTRPTTTPTVQRADDKHHYEIQVVGRTAGFTAYEDHDGRPVFYHTEVDASFAGQGLASQLVERALTDVRDARMRVVAVCPYVAKFLERRQEFADITDPVTPEILRWLATVLAH
ncbi:GNAT family N-acetyltransferase [Streptomyces nigra]|uniref:GNAT family N-acetyltransferase n=1 Tax=Streptomyces nigra TaxID=1827580 RepID=UPI0034123CE0